MIEASAVTYEAVSMDGRSWFSRNRGGGWRTMIDAVTGRATAETCFVEDDRFERMIRTGRAVAKPVDAAAVAIAHRWFTRTKPVERTVKAVTHEIRPIGSERA